jgi:hypothetical protein
MSPPANQARDQVWFRALVVSAVVSFVAKVTVIELGLRQIFNQPIELIIKTKYFWALNVPDGKPVLLQ